MRFKLIFGCRGISLFLKETDQTDQILGSKSASKLPMPKDEDFLLTLN